MSYLCYAMTTAERRREKLKNAVLYFVKKDKTVGLTKLMKLLFYLDFRLYRATGESLTGETYEAWDFGPVPADVWRELRHNEDAGMQLKEVVKVIPSPKDPRDEAVGVKLSVLPKVTFSDYYFTGREVKELKDVSEMFLGAPASLVVKAAHERNDPWDVTLKTAGAKAAIDYELALEGMDEAEKSYIHEVRDDAYRLEEILG